MTTKEKLEKALEALGLIETSTWSNMKNIKLFAGKIYAEITTPRTETVKVKRWVNVYPDGTLGGTLYDRKADALNSRDKQRGIPDQKKITIKVTRPIPKHETWEGKVPSSFKGKKIIVEVCE